jgi:hypothetical protein
MVGGPQRAFDPTISAIEGTAVTPGRHWHGLGSTLGPAVATHAAPAGMTFAIGKARRQTTLAPRSNQ